MSGCGVSHEGLTAIEPGVYADDGRRTMHICPAEYLVAQGYEPNAHNIAMIEQAARELCAELGAKFALIEAGP